MQIYKYTKYIIEPRAGHMKYLKYYKDFVIYDYIRFYIYIYIYIYIYMIQVFDVQRVQTCSSCSNKQTWPGSSNMCQVFVHESSAPDSHERLLLEHPGYMFLCSNAQNVLENAEHVLMLEHMILSLYLYIISIYQYEL